jgi:hypothetical protein
MQRPAIFDKLTPRTTFKHIISNLLTVVLIFNVLIVYCPLARAVGKPRKPPAPKIGKIFVVSPKTNNVLASGNQITVRYNVNDPDITSVKIKVSNGVDAASGTADLNEARVFLFQGMNTIELFGFAGSELDGTARASIQVECNSGCIAAAPPSGGMVQPAVTEAPAKVAVKETKPSGVSVPPGNSGGGKNLALRLPATVNAATVEPTVIVQEQSGIQRLIVDVYQNGHRVDSAELSSVDYQDGFAIVTSKVKIAEGVNEIDVFDPRHPRDPAFSTSSSLTCKGDKCVAVAQPAEAETAAAAAAPTPKKDETAANADDAIKIVSPDKPPTVNAPSIDVYLTVAKTVNKLTYEVKNGKQGTSDTIDLTNKPPEARTNFPVKVPLVKDTNTIYFYNDEERADLKQRVVLNVNCNGEHCASDFLLVQNSGATRNTRVIVGFEQAGGSSAKSETKPVLDLFFTTPFAYDHHRCVKPETEHAAKDQKAYDDCLEKQKQAKELARFDFWGDVRLAATPDQIAAAQVFPASLVNQVDKATSAVDLVQSFDFLAGGEVRLATANGNFLSLLPGVHQRTRLYFAAAGGAISPLTTRKESIQIFNIPGATDARRNEFVNRYGEPPDGKKYIAITPVDRDRFLRQWYAGIRLKTYYCENTECTRVKNVFPAIVDVMFGQNEAVTGGSRKRGGTPDPNDPNKLVGQKEAYVLRIDGFYPFPIKEANFLYFYGSAIMKIGGRVNITTPLFLDNPGTTVQISDPAVFMPSTSILKLQQPDRDYYKIGVGINLTDFFNRNKSSSH